MKNLAMLSLLFLTLFTSCGSDDEFIKFVMDGETTIYPLPGLDPLSNGSDSTRVRQDISTNNFMTLTFYGTDTGNYDFDNTAHIVNTLDEWNLFGYLNDFEVTEYDEYIIGTFSGILVDNNYPEPYTDVEVSGSFRVLR